MIRRIRQWLTSIALSTSAARNLLQRAGDAIREAQMSQRESERALSLMSEELRYQRMRLSERMNDMLDLRMAEVACVSPTKAQTFAEAWVGQTGGGPAVFKERLWELELALEDRGWVREQALAGLEFSRYGVGQLIRICRIYGIKNPLIKRGAEICALYVFGRGVEIRSEDDTADETIQDFLQRNSMELGHVGLAQKEQSAQTDGQLLFGLATKGAQVDLHMIDPLEILDVVTDPDDTSRDWYYRRQWNRAEFDPVTGIQNYEMKEAWYPSAELAMNPPAGKSMMIQGKPVNWEMPIIRVKLGCPPKWRWGIPPLYASIDWARAYKDFLEDWATVQRTLARFALMVETKGGPGAIAAYEALLSTTFGNASGTQIERNPPPTVGSAHVAGPDNKISAFKSAGAQVAPEQARRLMLMVAAAQGMPETFYGDASTGSLATAVSLDRPTELKFREIQQRWTDTLNRVLEYVLFISLNTPKSSLRESIGHKFGTDRIKEVRILRMVPRTVGNTVVWEAAKKTKETDIQIIVKFPAVLEHDIGVMVKAWTDVATLGGRQGVAAGIVDRRTFAEGMLSEVGVEQVDEKLDAMGYGEGYDPANDIQDQRTQVAPQQLTQPEPSKTAALDKAAEALREIARNGR